METLQTYLPLFVTMQTLSQRWLYVLVGVIYITSKNFFVLLASLTKGESHQMNFNGPRTLDVYRVIWQWSPGISGFILYPMFLYLVSDQIVEHCTKSQKYYIYISYTEKKMLIFLLFGTVFRKVTDYNLANVFLDLKLFNQCSVRKFTIVCQKHWSPLALGSLSGVWETGVIAEVMKDLIIHSSVLWTWSTTWASTQWLERVHFARS